MITLKQRKNSNSSILHAVQADRKEHIAINTSIQASKFSRTSSTRLIHWEQQTCNYFKKDVQVDMIRASTATSTGLPDLWAVPLCWFWRWAAQAWNHVNNHVIRRLFIIFSLFLNKVYVNVVGLRSAFEWDPVSDTVAMTVGRETNAPRQPVDINSDQRRSHWCPITAVRALPEIWFI